jgi:AraC family L-rhamnose operon regulatory protein RhaS
VDTVSVRYLDGHERVADSCEPLVKASDRGDVQLRAVARHQYPGVRIPEGCLPGVLSAGSWSAIGRQSWGLPWHRNEGLELTWISRGTVPFAVDDQRFELEPGHVTITRPWQRHRVGDPTLPPNELAWLILEVSGHRPNEDWDWPPWIALAPADLDRLTARLRQNETPVVPGSVALGAAFRQLMHLARRAEPLLLESALRLAVNQLLLALLETLDAQDMPMDASLSSVDRTVRLFLDDLRGHIAHQWTLGEMASRCGLGRTQFAVYCWRLTNRTPIGYLVQCRVERAAHLLSGTDRPVTEIAFECGFQSSQYFARTFRREFGCSPTAFRLRPAAA